MTSYAIQIKLCPECSSRFISHVLASSNTFGAELYTDGYMRGPAYDQGVALLQCPCCKKYLWHRDVQTLDTFGESSLYLIDEAKKLRKGIEEEVKKPEEDERRLRIRADIKNLPHAGGIYGDAFEDVLAQAPWKTEDQERYVRTRAWWASNDKYCIFRECDPEDFSLTREQEENLERLLELLDTRDINGVLMRAEIFRELGRFDECLNALDRPFETQYHNAVNVIKNLAKDRKRHVEVIRGFD